MKSNTLSLNTAALQSLMRDFYLLTGIKIVVFDREYNEVLAYPEGHSAFCARMHGSKAVYEKCMESNRQSFLRCQKTASLYIYHCHAGLVEATVPLIDNQMLIGYVMFGQVTDIPDRMLLAENLQRLISRYGMPLDGLMESVSLITYKTDEQIRAAASILEACSLYVLLKDMISLQRENFVSTLNAYLEAHLAEDLSVETLLSNLHISRRKLYDCCNEFFGEGIASYIKKLRLSKAKLLLKDTDLSVTEISAKVGFTDYNYFCREFKKEFGISAGKYRKQ